MAMEAGSMRGGTIPKSPLRPPAPPPCSPSPAASPLQQPTSSVGGGITFMPSTSMEQGGQASGDVEQDGVGSIVVEKQASGGAPLELQAGGEVLRSEPSSKNKRKKVNEEKQGAISPSAGSKMPLLEASGSLRARKANKIINSKESGKACGERQRSGDARGEHIMCETIGDKRSLSHASESSRVRKAAKTLNAKVVMTQLQNKSKPAERKMPLIVSRSPILNMIAR